VAAESRRGLERRGWAVTEARRPKLKMKLKFESESDETLNLKLCIYIYILSKTTLLS
jgi:hypothetical protein